MTYVCIVAATVGAIIYAFNKIVENMGADAYISVAKGNKYQLLPFNDALATEIMRIRDDLRRIASKQRELEWNDIKFKKALQEHLGFSFIHSDDISTDLVNDVPKVFTEIQNMYQSYPHSYLIGHFKTSDRKNFRGRIIIVLYDLDHFNDDDDYRMDSKGNSLELRKINSYKRYKIKSGMNFTVYIYDPDINGKDCIYLDDFKRTAKIQSISIKDRSYDSDYEDITLILEIDEYKYGDLNEKYYTTKEKIIREVEIYNNEYGPLNFIIDEK